MNECDKAIKLCLNNWTKQYLIYLSKMTRKDCVYDTMFSIVHLFRIKNNLIRLFKLIFWR